MSFLSRVLMELLSHSRCATVVFSPSCAEHMLGCRLCIFRPVGRGQKCIQKFIRWGVLSSRRIFREPVVGLAGSLIKQLFCSFFSPRVLLKLQPFFLNKRSVSLLVFLLSTCQSFVSCTFLKVRVGTRALGPFEDCVCGLDCSDISC